MKHTTSYLSWLATLTFLTLSSMPSYAKPSPTTSASLTTQKQRLTKGKAAPFDGVLLSDKALATIISGYEKKLKVIRLELERTKRDSVSDAKTAKAVCDAKVVGEQARRSACLRDLKRRDELLSKALGKSAPWYQSPQLHFVLGSLISGGVCAAAVRF